MSNKIAKRPPGARKPIHITRDQALITKYYLTGYSQAAISDILEEEHDIVISQSTVSRELRVIQERWVRGTSLDIDRQKVIELQKIDRLEQEYWDAWRNSIGEKKVGNYRFLNGVLNCIQQRCRIFGIEKSGETNINIGQQTFAQFVKKYVHKEK